MGDMKRLKEMDRRNTCLHESAHSVVRQLTIGNLGETGVVRGAAYSYPIVRKPFNEMERDELAKVAVVVAAGIVAERALCSKIGDQEQAIADDLRQWHGIRLLCGYSDEEMEAFWDEAAELVREYERVIRKVALELDRRNKLSGEQVSRMIKKYRDSRDGLRGLWHQRHIPAPTTHTRSSSRKTVIRSGAEKCSHVFAAIYFAARGGDEQG